MKKLVPNEFPNREPNKIAFVGEAPGQTEEDLGRPFVGLAGKALEQIAQSAGISRTASFFGNLCQFKPPGNKLEAFKWDGPEIQSGLRQLKEDLQKLEPNVVVLLGAWPLKAAGETKLKISDARGGRFICRDVESPFFGLKCLSTFHPSYIQRNWPDWPYLQLDLKRAVEEAKSPELHTPPLVMHKRPSSQELCDWLDGIKPGELVALDIEGTPSGITMISFAKSSNEVIQFCVSDYEPHGLKRILLSLKRYLLDPEKPKCLQNGLYDSFCLSWAWGMPIINIAEDTMLSGWELQPEMKKGLGTQVTIYTERQPYKYMKKMDDFEVFRDYNCLDSAVTYEISRNHSKLLDPKQLAHYRFNMELLPLTAYITRKGIRYDTEEAKRRHEAVSGELEEIEDALELVTGSRININSAPQKCDLLYHKLGFEKVYKIENGRRTNKLTADRDALLRLAKKYDHPAIPHILAWMKLKMVRQYLEYKPDHLGRMRAFYNPVGTETGRYSCAMKESEKADSVTLPGGAPLHTTTHKLRDLYLADEGYHFFQCDLEGADGWTVAAHCAHFGDYTMLEDYLDGIKPAKVLALMFLHQTGELKTNPSRLSRSELKDLIANTTIPYWLYFTCKRVQHGTNYDMRPRTMVGVIMKDSWKEFGHTVYLSERDCSKLQILYRSRYPGLIQWQNATDDKVNATLQLECPSGNTRTFYQRRRSHELRKEALAHEPQNTTTWVTSMASFNLWNDPENRIPAVAMNEKTPIPVFQHINHLTGNLELAPNHPIIQPLHQVHDAICGQFPIALTDWALTKIPQFFDNEIEIAGIKIKIPFDGGYGPSWGATSDKHPDNVGTIIPS